MKVTKETNMKWISVKERFPKKNDIVIISKEGFMGEVPYIAVFDGASFRHIEKMSDVLSNVTHWMLLPDAPL